ncbi:hypothetical protein AB4347_05625 [Vibrio breoganii]|uniref:Uncharacterized protein n=1 Tax=Vibrio breoganii TaxID=553239 RepID=A0AAP8MV41_9VIBR|nr:hypothetical protein [Vibrio breoganii]PMP09875.1 hypothetical protein BCS93_11475 [Vibrio breoganii]
MASVYITNYNLKNITNNSKKVIGHDELARLLPLIHDLSRMFSSIELSRFHIIHELLSNSESFINDHAIMINNFKKSKNNGGAFHSDHNCTQLNKNYLNVTGTTSTSNELFKILNNHFKSILYQDINDRELVYDVPYNIKLQFNMSDSAKVVIRKNSGHIVFENMSREDIVDEIQTLISSADLYRNSSLEISEEVGKLTYGTDVYGVIKDKPTIIKWKKEYKDKIADLLIAYLRVLSSGHLSDSLLESLNIHPCKSCFSNDVNTSNNNYF